MNMKKREKAIQAYKVLKKKHTLPSLKELEKEFDFELEDAKGIIKEVINKIWEKISQIKGWLEGLLHPQHYCCMFETEFFNKKEKERIFNIYMELMKEYWKTIKAGFGNEEENAKRLNKSLVFYKKIKKFATKYCDRMIKGWSEKEKEETKGEYIS